MHEKLVHKECVVEKKCVCLMMRNGAKGLHNSVKPLHAELQTTTSESCE